MRERNTIRLTFVTSDTNKAEKNNNNAELRLSGFYEYHKRHIHEAINYFVVFPSNTKDLSNQKAIKTC